MHDSTETLLGATVHHGPLNRRAYLIRLGETDPAAAAEFLEDLAARNRYGKIVARVPAAAAGAFRRFGYRSEARVPGLYGGRQAGHFLARYPDPARARESDPESVQAVAELAAGTAPDARRPASPDTARVEWCRPADAAEMAAVFRAVFRSYPVPVFDPAYLLRNMGGHSQPACIRRRGAIAALAAAEMDAAERCVEMTDFAVLPAYRGDRLAAALLEKLERHAATAGMRTAFTIARTRSTAINRLFARRGYRWAGILTNNTHISGAIQSMAVWYKALGE